MCQSRTGHVVEGIVARLEPLHSELLVNRRERDEIAASALYENLCRQAGCFTRITWDVGLSRPYKVCHEAEGLLDLSRKPTAALHLWGVP